MSRPGLLALVLHAHLPFVRHPEHERFLEETWLFEAITETYLPLAERFDRLAEEGVPVRLTMSFTPTLLAMLDDPMLQERYARYLDRLVALAEKEIERTRWRAPFHRLALFYHHRLSTARHRYSAVYQRDLIGAFRRLARRRVLELIGSCATHGFLPLLARSPSALRAQIHLGVAAFERAFRLRPQGFWLPECGYSPGCSPLLREEGIRYIITDAHSLLFAAPRPKYGVYAPAVCQSGVAVFGRDLDSSKHVWSAEEGYPGDPDYREFYRDIGYDLDYEYLRGHLNCGDEARMPTGIKYYRITGTTSEKQPYDPDRALDRAAAHAAHFVTERLRQVERVGALIDRDPLIVSPYDAELFGHWWFEGPEWLEMLLRKIQAQGGALALITPSEYLGRYPTNQPIEPIESSWGAGGYSDVWLNGANDWIYRHLHAMAERMSALADAQATPDRLTKRILNQMARELLLAQSSDWAFILKTQTHTAYAHRRLHDHFARFGALEAAVQHRQVDDAWLSRVEEQDRLFPFLDYRIYATTPRPTAPTA